jgi:hypothetical protein
MAAGKVFLPPIFVQQKSVCGRAGSLVEYVTDFGGYDSNLRQPAKRA